jgi:hypothetical protein
MVLCALFTSYYTVNCLQNDSELFGRTIRVNFAKPQRIKEGSTRPVWSEDTWLQQHAGETLEKKEDGKDEGETTETGEKVKFHFNYLKDHHFACSG